MEFFIFYIFSYFLTLLGFLLGKSTLEEHIEIKKTTLILVDILTLFLYLGLFYLIGFNFNLIIFILSFILFGFSFKFDLIKPLHDVFLFAIVFNFFYLNNFGFIYLVLFPMFFLVVQNSFDKFNFRELFYEILILILVFIGFSLFSF